MIEKYHLIKVSRLDPTQKYKSDGSTLHSNNNLTVNSLQTCLENEICNKEKKTSWNLLIWVHLFSQSLQIRSVSIDNNILL